MSGCISRRERPLTPLRNSAKFVCQERNLHGKNLLDVLTQGQAVVQKKTVNQLVLIYNKSILVLPTNLRFNHSQIIDFFSSQLIYPNLLLCLFVQYILCTYVLIYTRTGFT